METQLTGTKEVIFDTALRLAAKYGFENISMRAIADDIGIKASSIYNHFPGKESILDAFYKYYDEHKNDARKSVEYVKKVICTGTAYDIIEALAYDYLTLSKKAYTRILLTTKIIFMRMFSDTRASKIFFEKNIVESVNYVSELLDYGISINKLMPFDTAAFGNLMTTQLCFVGIKTFAASDYIVDDIAERENIITLLAGLLPMTNSCTQAQIVQA